MYRVVAVLAASGNFIVDFSTQLCHFSASFFFARQHYCDGSLWVFPSWLCFRCVWYVGRSGWRTRLDQSTSPPSCGVAPPAGLHPSQQLSGLCSCTLCLQGELLPCSVNSFLSWMYIDLKVLTRESLSFRLYLLISVCLAPSLRGGSRLFLFFFVQYHCE